MQVTISLDSLLALGRGPEVARFIGVASAALSQGVEHDELRRLLALRLAEQGLRRRARVVAEGLSPAAYLGREMAALLQSHSASSGDGCVPWQRLAGQFETNLAALRTRYAWTDQIAETWRAERRHLELHRSRDAGWQVLDRRIGRGGAWRPAFANHQPAPPAEAFREQLKNKILPPFVIEGVGLGFHLPWLHAATADTFLGASALIYQIEESWLALAVALHLGDWTTLAGDERVRLCGGPDAYDQFERFVEAETWNVPPAQIVRPVPWSASNAAQGVIQTLAARRESQLTDVVRVAGAQYGGRDRRWWHERYAAALDGSGPPLRVLGITSRFTTVLQYSLRDALDALRANGCQTQVLIEPASYARIPPAQKLEAIRAFDPDLILLIDHTRLGQGAGLVENVPVVTWVQDRLPWLFRRETGAALGPLDFVMGFNQRELVEQCGYPADRFLACEMATNPAALFPRGEAGAASRFEEAVDPRLECEVAYATNFSRTPEEFFTEYRSHAAPHLQALIAAVYEELTAMSQRGDLDGSLRWDCLIQRLERNAGHPISTEERVELAGGLARPLADRLLRLQTIEWAGTWAQHTGRRFHLYGNGWEKTPFASFARGFVKHGPELGQAFRTAKVHLHAGSNPAVHQRVLDGLAAGGFFLIRRSAGDFAHHITGLMAAAVRERNLRAGDRLGPRDLPDAACETWLAHRRRTGALDPYETVELTPQLLDRLAHWSALSELGPGQFAPDMHVAGDLWPQLDDVAFDTRAQFVERLEWYLAHDQERRMVAQSMRARVLDVLSYQALMKRMLAWMTERLARP